MIQIEASMSSLIWYPGHELLIKNIVRAENCTLFTSDGKKYIDLGSGVWCTALGHQHPRIVSVLKEQASKVTHTGFCYSNEIVEDAAQEILSLLGFEAGKCVFLSSGSEAVEYCVRVARSISDRPLLLKMTDSYFGAYGSASQSDEGEWFLFDWSSCTDCEEDCAHVQSIPFEKIGGFIFEPGSSSGFVRFPPAKLIQSIVAKIEENDGILLVNEVTTGLGRTGRWFGYQHYDLSPDIVALGKGLGNGYPVSAATFSPRIIERMEDRPLKHAQSHQNDVLGAAIAREVVRVIAEAGLIERSLEKGISLKDGLFEIKARTQKIEEIRARGLMIAIDLQDDSGASFTTYAHKELVKRGYVILQRPGTNTLRLDPSLTIEMEHIEGFLTALEEILST